MIGNYVFANPGYLWLMILLVPLIAWYILKNNSTQASVQLSSFEGFEGVKPGLKIYMRHVPFDLRMIALTLVVVVLARPQSTNNWQKSDVEGIDIMMSVDLSGSMLAEDLKPNRLKAAIDVATEFISARPNDRIGLVVFSGESFTQCPLTTDQAVLINLFRSIDAIKLEDGTAIGNGIATAVARLKDSKAKSRIVILLTDGSNNAGEVSPQTAAELAKTFGIRVYTIGVGTKGTAPYPIQTNFGIQYQNVKVEIDEDLLKSIAATTDGRYFRATDNETLKSIYNEIDQLEKSKIDVKEFSKKNEEYLRFAIAAVILLLLEAFIRLIVLKQIP